MAVCPECGSEVDSGQEYCRECGSSVEAVEDVTEARIHLQGEETPVTCQKVSYPSMGGDWIRAQMKDNTTRIYPMNRIEYVEASPGLGNAFAEPEPGNVQVKEVESFDSISQLLGSVKSALK